MPLVAASKKLSNACRVSLSVIGLVSKGALSEEPQAVPLRTKEIPSSDPRPNSRVRALHDLRIRVPDCQSACSKKGGQVLSPATGEHIWREFYSLRDPPI